MEYKIALAGNPNCGKTTMFNDLTGSSQYVGNWPGVTVEKKEGKLKANKQAMIYQASTPFPHTHWRKLSAETIWSPSILTR